MARKRKRRGKRGGRGKRGRRGKPGSRRGPDSKIMFLARRGVPDAQFRLGEMYLLGDDGPRQDSSKAVRWFRAAAEQGHTDAQVLLAEMYREGDGVEQDLEEAAQVAAGRREGRRSGSVRSSGRDVRRPRSRHGRGPRRGEPPGGCGGRGTPAGPPPAERVAGREGVSGAGLTRVPRDGRGHPPGGLARQPGGAVLHRKRLSRRPRRSPGRRRGGAMVAGGGQAGRRGRPERPGPDVHGGRWPSGTRSRAGVEVAPRGGPAGRRDRDLQSGGHAPLRRRGTRPRPGEVREAESEGGGDGVGGRPVQPRSFLLARARSRPGPSRGRPLVSGGGGSGSPGGAEQPGRRVLLRRGCGAGRRGGGQVVPRGCPFRERRPPRTTSA